MAAWISAPAQEPLAVALPADSISAAEVDELDDIEELDEALDAAADSVPLHRRRMEFDEAYDAELRLDSIAAETGERVQVFNPDATRAVWLSALCPGLGQLYNRRYWKLPIVVGAYMGLAYATSWNNSMLTDYTKAYRDLIDNDPDTKSYMDFFAPNVQESSLSKSWLENLFKSRKKLFPTQPRPLHHLHGGSVSACHGRCLRRRFVGSFRHFAQPDSRLVANAGARNPQRLAVGGAPVGSNLLIFRRKAH
jgi:hypothetical protein